MQWTTACPDWEQKLRLGQSIIPRPLFPQEAEAGLAVLRELKIVDAPGSNGFWQARPEAMYRQEIRFIR